MSRKHLAAWVFASLSWAGSIAGPGLAEEPTEASATDFSGLIEQLGSPDYDARRGAKEDLISAGPRVIPGVQRLVASGTDLEARIRGLEILREMALREGEETRRIIHEAARELASLTGSIGRRATALEREIRVLWKQEAQSRLESLGARLTTIDAFVEWQIMRRRNVVGGPMLVEVPLVERLVLDRHWTGTVEDLECLREIPEIAEIVIDGPAFGDPYLAKLGTLPHLERLLVREASITNEALAKLKDAPMLSLLSIWYVSIDDGALEHVRELASLTQLLLLGTEVSDEGVEALRTRRENLLVDSKHGAFLGVSPQTIPGQPPTGGVALQEVRRGHAAAQAGLQSGDVILSFEGKAVDDFDGLKNRISEHRAGDAVRLRIRRAGKEFDQEVVLGKWHASDWFSQLQGFPRGQPILGPAVPLPPPFPMPNPAPNPVPPVPKR